MKATLNITDVLSGRARLEGIRWLLLAPAPRRTLRDQLEGLLSAPAKLGWCRLRRARFKPGRKLTAYYDVLVRREGTVRDCARPVAVTWESDGPAGRRHAMADLAESQAEAIRQGVAAPFRQLATELPAWRMRIQVSPLDARFPQLVRLSDPRYVRGVLAAGASGHASDEPRPRYAVTAIRYRPGQRHVLRYDPQDAAQGGTVFAKLYTGEDGARVFHVATRVGEWLAEHGQGVTAVRPVACVVGDRVVLYPGLSGGPLSDLLRRPGRGVARCLERVGAALHALHRLPLAVAGPLPRHDLAAEVSEVARASEHLGVLLLRPRLWEAVELVKITARRVPLFDPDWAPRTRQAIRRAGAVLRELERTLGLPATPPAVPGGLEAPPTRRCARRPERARRGARC